MPFSFGWVNKVCKYLSFRDSLQSNVDILSSNSSAARPEEISTQEEI